MLLMNRRDVLPLSPTGSARLALIGPLADATTELLGSYGVRRAVGRTPRATSPPRLCPACAAPSLSLLCRPRKLLACSRYRYYQF